MVIPGPLVSVLFERGAFGPEDSAATAMALAIYGLGLPAFVLQKVVQPVFFAREDTRSPFRYAIVAMLVNLVLAVGLAPVLGYLAAPVATTFAGWAMFVLLLRGARRIDGGIEPDRRLRRSALGMLAASAVMGVVVAAMSWGLAPALETEGLRYLALIGMILAGAVVYAVAVHGTGAFTAKDMRDMLRRG